MAIYFLIITLLTQLLGLNAYVLERIPNVNCSFSLGHHIYDLSILSGKSYWTYMDAASIVFGRSYSISICHPLTMIEGCEDSNGCYTYLGISNTNRSNIRIGKVTSNDNVPQIIEDGNLQYSFTNGDPCPAGRQSTTYSTKLFLQCPMKNEKESYGPILMSSTACSYLFVWITKAACPKKHKIEDPQCTALFNDNSSVNFNSLMSPTYHPVKNMNASYEINVCGPIVNGTCLDDDVSICDISDKSNPQPVALYKNVHLDWNSTNGNFIYNFGGSSDILFECNREMMQPKFSIDRVHPHTLSKYHFKIETAFACLSTKNNCILRNSEGYLIDLRPLRRNDSNWEIVIPMNTKKFTKRELYLINVCGPLIPTEDNRCPKGPVGACKPSVNSRGSLNMGYAMSDPVMQTNGTIIISYKGGDPCRKDGPSSSTQITLYCSKTEHLPELITVTTSCKYIFEWRTPAACPIETIIGKDCKVEDPVLSEVFDLNPLRNLSSDYLVKSASGNFRINVCGNLLSDCNGHESSVCVVGNNGTQSGGKAPGHLAFDDGTLIMEFKNGDSCGDGQWSTKILVLCNHAGITSVPEHFQTNKETCTHFFIWHTIHACPSFTAVDCFVHEGDNVYDLTALSEPTDNWEFESSQNGTSRRFVFNICRSIVHSKAYRCSYKSGSCLMDASQGSGRAKNLGNVKSSPVVHNGTVMIHYKDGDMCTNVKRYETLLVFECVPWAYNNMPILTKEEDCQYVIKVPTNHACPKTVAMEVEQVGGNCSLVNPFTGYTYDFSSLNAIAPAKLNYKNDTIYLNVCGQLNSASECSPAGSGSCLLSARNGSQPVAKNMGMANSILLFSRWNAFLEYKDGDRCDGMPNGRRNTRISFVCSENNYVHGPTIVDYDEGSCTLYVNWHTKLACEVVINCFAKRHDGRLFNLTPFAKFYSNYEIANPYLPNTTYYINICKPLNPMAGIRCHPGSAGCMVVEGSNGTTSVSSLGHLLLDPVASVNDEVALFYSHGSACPLDKQSHASLSSRVTFICNRTIGVGAPVFLNLTHDCHVLFEWHTSMICDNEIDDNPSFGNQCQIYMEKAKANVDIQPLYKPTGYQVTYANKVYNVNVCGAVCKTSGVCSDDGTSYGLLSSVDLQWESDLLKLAYYTGAPCNEALTFRRSSVIYFECDMDAGYGAPVAETFNNPNACIISFSWRTNVTCIEAIYKPTDTRLPSTEVSPIVPSEATNTTAVPFNADAKEHNSGNVGVSIFISVMVICLVVVVSGVVFFRSMHGRRLTTQAKGFFRTKGDEVFILDDQHYHIIDL